MSFNATFPIWLNPIIGGLLTSLVIFWDGHAEGFGSNYYIQSINFRNGNIPLKTFFSKLIASACTIGFYGSGGYEGPMLMIGGSLGNYLSWIPIVRNYCNEEEHRIMSICGAAGALGAIFHSPLGGGLFVVEILYKSSLHYTDLFPAMLSSTIGYTTFSMIYGPDPLFKIPGYKPDINNIILFIISGIIAGLVSLLFMSIFEKTRLFFEKNETKLYNFSPVFGGILTGIILIFITDVGGTGVEIIQNLIFEPMPVNFLILLLVGKILATSFTIGSKGSAGLVIPALFIGAVMGNMIASIIGVTAEGLTTSLVAAGMAGSFASIANVPVAAAVILIEMMGLQLGVPAIIGSVVGYAVGRRRIIYDTTHVVNTEYQEGKSFRKADRHYEE
ncbi:MAG: chloride channel protein [Bacillota bacterium]